MPTRRYFSNFAPRLTLATSIGSTDTSLQVQTTFASWPTQFPYYATLDYGTASVEIIQVTSVIGAVATIVRGQDGSIAIAHAAGATLDQTAIRMDYDEANAHTTSTGTGIHGVTGHLVGDDDVQTLTNKTLASPVVTGTATCAAITASGLITASGGFAINTVTDWNTATTTGFYHAAAAAANAPNATQEFFGIVFAVSATEVQQVLWAPGGSAAAPRFARAGSGSPLTWAAFESALPYQVTQSGTPLWGTVPAAPAWQTMTMTASVTTDVSGRYLVTLPASFPNAFVSAQVSNSLSTTGAADAIWTLDPSFGASHNQIWLQAVKSSTGAAYASANLSFTLTATGC